MNKINKKQVLFTDKYIDYNQYIIISIISIIIERLIIQITHLNLLS